MHMNGRGSVETVYPKTNLSECRHDYCLHRANLDVLYGPSSLVCLLVESSSNVLHRQVCEQLHSQCSWLSTSTRG